MLKLGTGTLIVVQTGETGEAHWSKNRPGRDTVTSVVQVWYRSVNSCVFAQKHALA